MIELQRDDNLAPGTWRPLILDNERTAKVACPSCGKAAPLDHEIAADGTVTPSLVCPFAPCTFHDNVKLVGWAK